jgi:hypothetical protein
MTIEKLPPFPAIGNAVIEILGGSPPPDAVDIPYMLEFNSSADIGSWFNFSQPPTIVPDPAGGSMVEAAVTGTSKEGGFALMPVVGPFSPVDTFYVNGWCANASAGSPSAFFYLYWTAKGDTPGGYDVVTGPYATTVLPDSKEWKFLSPVPNYIKPPFGMKYVQVYVRLKSNAGVSSTYVSKFHTDKWNMTLVRGQPEWLDATPQSMVIKLGWGADDPAGVLTVPAAGAWNVRTYDPDRKLDPANGTSPFASYLHPGRPMRIGVRTPDGGFEVVRQGLLDEVTFDVYTKTGTMQGTDIVPLIVHAKLPDPGTDPNMPTTLRARARYLLDKAGLKYLVPVEESLAPDKIINNSFEDEWNGWIIGPYASRSPTYPIPDGDWNAVITGNGTNYPGLSQARFAVAEGEQYVLSGWARRRAGTTLTAVSRVDGNVTGTVVASNRWDKNGPTGVWEYRELAFTIPAGCTEINTLSFIEGAPVPVGNVVDFDLISIRKVIPDPPVGPLPDDKDVSVWSLIGTSAYDCLHAMWIDRLGVLRFRSFGDPRDNGFQVGGNGGIPIETLGTNASLANIITVVRAFDETAPTVPIIKTSDDAIEVYGYIPLTREKPVPLAEIWATNVLNDRSGSALQYKTGTLYPRNVSELRSLLELEMIDTAHIVADDVTPTIDVTGRVLGARLTADTDTGWTAEVTTYIPSSEWVDAPVPPVIPPVIPPVVPPTHQETRYYNATKDTRAARDTGGTGLGSGTEGELPVGAWQGWRNRAFLAFESIPWGGVVSVDQCLLELDTSDQVNVGFGSAPKVVVSRVTQGWGEGSSSSPSGSNSTKYPGPSTTSTNQRTQTVTRTENAAVGIDITAIARDWKAGAGTYGVRIISAGEDATKYTTEFWSRENSNTGKRPRLKLVVTVEDTADGKPVPSDDTPPVEPNTNDDFLETLPAPERPEPTPQM